MSNNRSTKRLFAVALSLMMVLALLPVTALAATGDLTGTVTIMGDAKFGETLGVNTASLSIEGGGVVGELNYQWIRASAPIADATESTYTIVEADIGQTISVEVTSSTQPGTVTSSPTSTVAKADGPGAPTVEGSYVKAGSTITYTIDPIPGAEYNVDGDSWQSSNVFTGLVIDSSHTFYARIAETTTHEAGTDGNTGSVALTLVTGSGIGVTSAGSATEIATEGGTLRLTATVAPGGAQQKVVWSIVSGAGYASISTVNDLQADLTARFNGVVTVRATAVDATGEYDEITITLENQRDPAPPQVIVPETPEVPDVVEPTPDDDLPGEDEDDLDIEEDEDIVDDDIVEDVPGTGDSAVNAAWTVLVSTLVLGAAVAFVMKKKAAGNR